MLPTRWHLGYANRNEAWVVERDALDIPYVVRYEIMQGNRATIGGPDV